MRSLQFQKCLDLTTIPSDWSFVNLSVDWAGNPLVLFVEGKAPQPDFHQNPDLWSSWCRTPPKAHHLVYLETEKMHSVAFDQSKGLSTFHVQRFNDGWLLGDRRGSRTTVYDSNGYVRSRLDLGDGSEDLQTTSDGQIWVSYFDEGVFGGGIGKQGLVCFDSAGQSVFEYGAFAEQNELPMICDCYAMNVDQSGAVWVNYYTDFPLVLLRDFKTERAWNNFGSIGKSFAVREDCVICERNNQLVILKDFSSTQLSQSEIPAKDDEENTLHYSSVAARGSSLAVRTDRAVYMLSE